MNILKKFSLVLSLSILAMLTASFLFIVDSPVSRIVRASTSDSISGWAWSGEDVDGDATIDNGIGFINFNCTDNNASCATAGDWGVNIDVVTGELDGYAWGENVGWISFNRSDTGTPPQAPFNGSETYIAKYFSDTGDVQGWGKILNLGDKGWINFRGGESDGAQIVSCEFTGWAWNGNDDGTGIGWISLNNDTGGGSTSYFVASGLLGVPSASVVRDLTNACSALTISWDDVECADKYEVWRVPTSSGTPETEGAILVNTIYPTNVSQTEGGLASNTTYYYVVRAFKGVTSADSDVVSTQTHSVCSIGVDGEGYDVTDWGECPNTVHMSWGHDEDADSYKIYRSDDGSGGTYNLVASGACSSPTSGVACADGVSCACDDAIPGVTANKQVYYKISGIDDGIGADESPKFGPIGPIVACPLNPTVYEEINVAE